MIDTDIISVSSFLYLQEGYEFRKRFKDDPPNGTGEWLPWSKWEPITATSSIGMGSNYDWMFIFYSIQNIIGANTGSQFTMTFQGFLHAVKIQVRYAG